MTFKSAKCPNCGGMLQLPKERRTAICMYCGQTIVVVDAIKLAGGVNIDNLMQLAQHAIQTTNYKTAHSYYSKILEHDIENVGAWIGKGVTDSLRNNETAGRGWISDGAKRCFQKGLDLSENKMQCQQQIVLSIQSVFAMPRFSHLGITYDHVTKYAATLDPENVGVKLSSILQSENFFDELRYDEIQKNWPSQRLETYRMALALANKDTILVEAMTEQISNHLERWGRPTSSTTGHPGVGYSYLESSDYNYKKIVAFAEAMLSKEIASKLQLIVQRRFKYIKQFEIRQKLVQLENERYKLYSARGPWVIGSRFIGGCIICIIAFFQYSSRQSNRADKSWFDESMFIGLFGLILIGMTIWRVIKIRRLAFEIASLREALPI